MSDEVSTREEELQLLVQLARQPSKHPLETTHSKTYHLGRLLIARGEAMGWWTTRGAFAMECTHTGYKTLVALGLRQPIEEPGNGRKHD